MKLKTVVDEWLVAINLSETCLRMIEEYDVPLDELLKATLLQGEERKQRLEKIASLRESKVKTGQSGLEDIIQKSFKNPLTLKFLENAFSSLYMLAKNKDNRAFEIFASLDFSFFSRTTEIGVRNLPSFSLKECDQLYKIYNASKSIFGTLHEKIMFCRDIVRSCYMNVSNPTWNIQKPPIDSISLFITQGHSSAIMAVDWGVTVEWHIAKIREVRRTRCSGDLLYRIRPLHISKMLKSYGDKPKIEEIDKESWDYSLSNLVTYISE